MIDICWRVSVPNVATAILAGHCAFPDTRLAPGVVLRLRLPRMVTPSLRVTHPLLRKDTLLIRRLIFPLSRIRIGIGGRRISDSLPKYQDCYPVNNTKGYSN